jgi:glucan biosynthesis protein C
MRARRPLLGERVETRPGQSNHRLHAIDWLRVLAVLAVFFYHVAHIFDFDLEGSVRNSETSLGASVYVFFVHQWSMPLLFLLAGVSSWFSLRSRPTGAYLRERVQRLLVPLLFGTVFLIPWNGYMSALNRRTFDGSYWQFLPVHFERTAASLMPPQVHHGLVALYYTSWHLWFLGYLLIFSTLALLWALRTPDASGLAALCQRRAGLLALVAPIVLVKLSLGARFPAYLDWSDTLVYLTVFFYGWLFMTDGRFLSAVEQQALTWLSVGSACFAILLGTYALGYLSDWLAHPRYSADYLLYQLLAALNTWAWILAVIGCGLRWLNIDIPLLRYAGDATLPFYILHQLVVLTVAVFIVQWRAGIGVKIVAISSVAFTLTLLSYEVFIRRYRVLRVLFGLKLGDARAMTTFTTDTQAGSRFSSWR